MKNLLKIFIFLSLITTIINLKLTTNLYAANKCGGVDTSIISCDQDNKPVQGDNDKTLENNAIWGILLLVLNILTGGVGILAVGGIVYGAMLYTSSGGKPEQTKKAIEVIRNVVIGLIAYLGMYVLLQFLIPGGIFT